MVSTFTPNIQLEEPARGDDVGTWDTPVNSNMTLIDNVVGGVARISLNNSPVVLNSAQFQAKTIVFSSTLTGNVAITFPTSFTKSYEIINLCTGSSAFVVTLGTTNPGINIIGCKPSDPFDVIYDASSFRYKNLGAVGSYWDYAGSSVPAWVSACSIPPFLQCDATTFSSGTYPTLATLLGGTTLPDARGRYRATLNQGTGRITSSQGGVDGNTALAAGSSQTATLITGNLPPYTPAGSVPVTNGTNVVTVGGAGSDPFAAGPGASRSGITVSASFSGSPQGGLSTPFSVLPPTYVGGITMIRAG